jgi:hypothetical protein
MDWDVQIVTKQNQIKTVRVTDYIYPTDAINAAIAQTDAVRVVNYSLVNKEPDLESHPNPFYNTSYYDSSDSYWDNNQFFQYFIVTLIPSVLLWIISPVICCIFNAVLFYYWFKK